MNCDDAFEQLTDPDLRDGAALEMHLAGCSRCRDMAEVLEPALRFVTGRGDDSWSDNVEDNYLPHTSAPTFLTQRAVSVAEEAAAALSAKSRPRRPSPRPMLLALALLAPVILGAVLLFNQDSQSSHLNNEGRFPLPEFGPCTRAEYANPADKTEDNFRFAHDVVMSCNSCHLLRDPRPPIDGEAYLKLSPAAFPFRFDLKQSDTRSTVAATRMMQWQIAGIPVLSHNC